MHKIFYENIFISDIITNKSLTIEEMLELTDFDEQAFKAKHGFESLDPADFSAIYFDFEQSLPHIEPEIEERTDVDGSGLIYRFKKLALSDNLTLTLFDNAQATLEYRHNAIEMCRCVDEAARPL